MVFAKNISITFFVILSLINIFGVSKNKGKFTTLGEKAYAQAKYDLAYDYFQKAIEAEELGGEAYFFIGNILELKRNYNESISYFISSVEKELDVEYKRLHYGS